MYFAWGAAVGPKQKRKLRYYSANLGLRALAVLLINFGALCASLAAVYRCWENYWNIVGNK